MGSIDGLQVTRSYRSPIATYSFLETTPQELVVQFDPHFVQGEVLPQQRRD